MAITTNGKVSITNLQVGSSADLASIISDESGTGVLAFTNSPTFTTPALGTPSAVTLTNATGLPVSGITASTSAPIGVGTIELGHATDTTISRASAGVVAIEGVNVVTETATQTLTNKTLTSPVISTITNTGTLTLPTTTGTVALTSDITVTASSTNTLSNKSISLTTNTVSGTTAEFNTALSDGDFATLAGSETLSNKTLTAPKFADLGFIADANGNELVILDTVASAVNEVTLANAATGNAPTLTASGGDTNVSLNLVPKGSGTVQIGGVNAVTTSGTQTLTNKTLTSPALTDGTIVDSVIKGLEEDVNVVASAATGTINFDVATASVWYYTSNATANHTLNFRYDGSNTLASKLATGDAITLVWLNTNGSTAYYPSTIQIDGSTVTPKVPAAISSGNASAIDAYSFTIIKTAATPTYTVLETQTKFA